MALRLSISFDKSKFGGLNQDLKIANNNLRGSGLGCDSGDYISSGRSIASWVFSPRSGAH
jgi:hypothetical protein